MSKVTSYGEKCPVIGRKFTIVFMCVTIFFEIIIIITKEEHNIAG